MVELSINTTAWRNYLRHLDQIFTQRVEIARVESITAIINLEHNGIVIDNNGWNVYFKSEQDLSYFLLKWA